jgi:hypothetical protein
MLLSYGYTSYSRLVHNQFKELAQRAVASRGGGMLDALHQLACIQAQASFGSSLDLLIAVGNLNRLVKYCKDEYSTDPAFDQSALYSIENDIAFALAETRAILQANSSFYPQPTSGLANMVAWRLRAHLSGGTNLQAEYASKASAELRQNITSIGQNVKPLVMQLDKFSYAEALGPYFEQAR